MESKPNGVSLSFQEKQEMVVNFIAILPDEVKKVVESNPINTITLMRTGDSQNLWFLPVEQWQENREH